jgi:predicted outer membrane protein
MRALALPLVCALAAVAAAGGASRAAPASPSPETQQLRAWLADVHRGDELAMQLGRLAKRRGDSGLVRRFGDRLERDQRDCDHRLFKLARERGLPVDELPPDARQELAIQRLRALNGPGFDKLFAQTMAQEQRRQEDRLGKALAAADVRRLVALIRPILRQHEELARYLQRKSA